MSVPKFVRTLLKIVLPAMIVLVGIVTLVLLVAFKPEPAKRPGHLPRPLVETFEVTGGGEPLVVTGFGTVRAKRTVTVVPRVSGLVVAKSFDFEAGGFFTEGETLIRIDETDYVVAVERAEAELARARYNLARAEEEAEVAVREWQQINETAADPSPLVRHEPQLELAHAEQAAAEAALERARIDLQRCTIVAPFTGRVLDEAVDSGQFIRAGSQIGAIYATDTVEITVPIPDEDLAWIDVPQGPDDVGSGSPVRIVAEFAGAVHEWSGRTVRTGGAIDQQSRLVSAVVEVVEPYDTTGERPPLVPGMFVEARFLGRAPAGAVAIPRSALRPGDRVWVVTEQQTIDIRPVAVARAGVERAIVTDGIAVGEAVCVSNLQYVTAGMQVRTAGSGGEAK